MGMPDLVLALQNAAATATGQTAQTARESIGILGAVLQEAGREAPANGISSVILVPLFEWAKHRGWVKPGDETKWTVGLAAFTAGSIHLSLDTSTWNYAVAGNMIDLLRFGVDYAKQHGLMKWMYYGYRALRSHGDPEYVTELEERRRLTRVRRGQRKKKKR